MRHAHSTRWLRLAAFVALGSFVLHQARYAFGEGGHAGEALARDGHAHMGLALAISLLIAIVVPLLTLMLAAVGPPQRRFPHARIGPLRCALVLVAAFWLQELGEGVLSASHPSGLEAIFGHGGLIVFPLALLLGYLVSLLQGSLDTVEDRVAGSMARRRLAEAIVPEQQYVEPERPPHAGLGLVFGFACRPPPSLITSI